MAPERESVLQEAQRIVHGDRGVDYGHPSVDFGRTAGMLTALFAHKLREGARFEATDVGLIQICVKLSREVNRHKRDTLVDIGGYAETVQMIHDVAPSE